MGMLTFSHVGNFEKTTSFLNDVQRRKLRKSLEVYGQMGVDALSAATPVDTGKTAASWSYTIKTGKKGLSIIWKNSNLAKDGSPIALLIQYGHATARGGYVEGRDYINPALKPVFEHILHNVWKEVTAV